MKIITIMPGFENTCAWLNDDYDDGRLSHSIADAANGFHFTGFKVTPELEQGFANWMAPYVRSEHTQPGFSWKEFHEAGIALARRLKAEIGAEARVLYCHPSADPDTTTEPYIEFLNNGKMIYLASPQRKWRPSKP
jgi:hypothetical protein